MSLDIGNETYKRQDLFEVFPKSCTFVNWIYCCINSPKYFSDDYRVI